MAKPSLLSWFDKHGAAIQGIGTIMTGLIALAALIGVKMQIDAAARTQQEQSARDIYREFLNLSISKPEFSEPDYCAIVKGPQASAYKNYVDYLLYTSEQMLSVSPEWSPALTEHLAAHEDYLCSVSDWSGYPDNVRAMVESFRAKACKTPHPPCE
jgi:hypothetical protein